jgi:hypothetical protein
MLDYAFLMRIVAGRTGDASSRDERKYNDEPFFCLFHIFQRSCRWSHKKMLAEKRLRHGRVTAPAKKTYVGPKLYRFSPVHSRIRLLRMTDETYRLAIDLPYIARAVQHYVGIDSSILFPVMTLKADFPSVSIGTTPQEFCRPAMVGPTVYFMTGETSNLSFKQGKRQGCGASRDKIDRVVVLLIVMAAKTKRRWFNAWSKEGAACLRTV